MPAPRTSLALSTALLAALLAGCTGTTAEDGCTPVAEVCNGRDDDCDGAVDEGLGELTCGVGVCVATVPACLGGAPQTCTPGPAQSPEGCDGLDDDCDGLVDEGCDCVDGNTQGCYTGPPGTAGAGECRAGTQTCAGGAWGACAGERTPGAEACNGLDDDCDGEVDEGFDVGTGCTAGVGACASMGLVACLPDGSGTSCDAPVVAPAAETCNGADDDCDGSIDEELVGPACPLQLGVCAGSTAVCGVAGWECSQESYGPDWEPVETMCDAHDNDCDGTTNEDLTLTVYRDADFDGWGNPSAASQACTRLAGWSLTPGDCDDARASTYPGAIETCNLRDDDCDGVVDEGC